MSLTKWRKPHSIRLPGGFSVPIVYWSDRKMKSVQKSDPTLAKEDLSGYWDGEKIVINSSEPLWEQIDVLGHELVHAIHDYSLWLRQHVCEPMKAEAGEALLAEVEEDLNG